MPFSDLVGGVFYCDNRPMKRREFTSLAGGIALGTALGISSRIAWRQLPPKQTLHCASHRFRWNWRPAKPFEQSHTTEPFRVRFYE
jgi:hypothetical protein